MSDERIDCNSSWCANYHDGFCASVKLKGNCPSQTHKVSDEVHDICDTALINDGDPT